MKKKIYFIFFVILITFNAIGQVWIDKGAVWHYDYWTIGYGGFSKYEYSKDSLIDGRNCQMITGKAYEFARDQYNNIVLVSIKEAENQLTYVSGDTVFYRNNGQFFVLYNFGASIGDSWVISASDKPFGVCNDTSRIEVIDTGRMIINYTSYRFIKVKPTPDSPVGLQGTYVERFGNIDEKSSPFQSLFPVAFQCDSLPGIMEWNFFSFKCYEDNSFTRYNPSNIDCEYYLTLLGINETSQNQLYCYPNPTEGIINIERNSSIPTFVEIYNQQGTLLRTFSMDNNTKQIDVSDFPAGLYLLKSKSGDYKQLLKKIIKK